ncbi:conserved hypothetical protein [Rubrivivax sp. A210]|uniref:hypothetical protein n=1 Tax=Rubrivivax sp. A210 TaxID=2772301 RepID=UPI00191ABDF6|nr:hypothetical protein [Rubrivivax sp. A210]CAD5366022.1 conserved hypothetical protein [Rubrivivax sp. A210]
MATLPTFNQISKNQTVSLDRSQVVVEVAAQPVFAKVVREGFQVPPVTFNPAAADFFLDNLDVLQPRQTPRVVGQSIKPGTKVNVGTVVDLVLAPASVIPFNIFENVHADLAQRNVGDLLDGMLADPVTRQTVLKYEKAEDVPLAERTALTESFVAADVRINDAAPTTSFTAAFNAARGALAFK